MINRLIKFRMNLVLVIVLSGLLVVPPCRAGDGVGDGDELTFEITFDQNRHPYIKPYAAGKGPSHPVIEIIPSSNEPIPEVDVEAVSFFDMVGITDEKRQDWGKKTRGYRQHVKRIMDAHFPNKKERDTELVTEFNMLSIMGACYEHKSDATVLNSLGEAMVETRKYFGRAFVQLLLVENQLNTEGDKDVETLRDRLAQMLQLPDAELREALELGGEVDVGALSDRQQIAAKFIEIINPKIEKNKRVEPTIRREKSKDPHIWDWIVWPLIGIGFGCGIVAIAAGLVHDWNRVVIDPAVLKARAGDKFHQFESLSKPLGGAEPSLKDLSSEIGRRYRRQ